MRDIKVLCLLLSFSLSTLHAKDNPPPKRIKLVILDNSGTTNDCGVYAPAVVFIRLFTKYGIEISMPEAREPMGLFKKDHIRAILKMKRISAEFKKVYGRDWIEKDVEKMFEDFVPMQLNCLGEYTDLIPGTAQTVDLIREKFGVLIGSTTGFNKEMNEVLLQEAKTQGYHPDVNTSSSQVKRGRPYWYMVQENMRLADVEDPQEVLKVGDTRGDMQEGKAMAKVASSGTWTLGLSATGNYVGKNWEELTRTPGNTLQEEMCSTEKILFKAGADYVAPNINSLPEIIERINERLAAGEKPREISLDYLEQ
jgi:phosphonoacetaldehyde hydrolase